jgi:hypothetical protein
VGTPVHERGNIPRWSRWAASATTFGPWGRVVATVLVFAVLLSGLLLNGVFSLLAFPIAAAILLRDIWAKGWVVPDADRGDRGTRPVASPETRVVKTEREPIAVTDAIRWTSVLAGIAAFTYGPIEVKAGVVGVAGIALLWWLWTSLRSLVGRQASSATAPKRRSRFW